jgi:hypothetical protein
MNKSLLTTIGLLLTSAVVATVPIQTTTEEIQTTTEEINTINAIAEVRWGFFTDNWDTCVINGKTYNDVTFVYTGLGLAYETGNVLRYEPELIVSYCETTVEDSIK